MSQKREKKQENRAYTHTHEKKINIFSIFIRKIKRRTNIKNEKYQKHFIII